MHTLIRNRRQRQAVTLLCGLTALLATAAAPARLDTDPAKVRLEENKDYVGSGFALPGQKLTVAYNFFNDGPATADRIVAEGWMPEGLSLLATSAGPCSEPEPGLLRCEHAGVKPGKGPYDYALPTFQVSKDYTEPQITFGMNMTSYVNGEVSDSAHLAKRWKIEQAAAYAAPDETSFPQSRPGPGSRCPRPRPSAIGLAAIRSGPTTDRPAFISIPTRT
ncbi:hypothetical protein [Streptomyces sp. NBC_01304]|uniref:hypothetical protein n=1 Tax=Streptomyces sp. NBC_01304 TaxID=2903818 RepID=UPI002E10FBDB|nr:hypothetical protein OG430_42690 [Streptomyces sp. NBC_01304]